MRGFSPCCRMYQGVIKMIRIASALNDTYAPYTYVMLSSVFDSDPEEDFQIILLSHDLSEESKTLFRDLADAHHSSVVFPKISPKPFAPFEDKGWALPASFMLALPYILKEYSSFSKSHPESFQQIFFSHVEDSHRLLYLDGDIIVHNSLRPLWETDLEDCLLGACQDMTVNPNTTAYYAPMRDPEINRILNGGNYFNSGVLLIDTEKWTSFSLDYYLELLNKLKGKVAAPDQDLLNVAHEKDWLSLDEIRYDMFAAIAKDHEVTLEEILKYNTILHYAGDKPWHGGHVHYKIEKLWWEYALKTPFAEEFMQKYIRTSMEDETIFNAVKEITEQNAALSEELDATLEKAKEILAKLGQ